MLDGFEVEDFEFVEDIRAYQYVNGEIVLNKERLEQLRQAEQMDAEIQELQQFLDETQAVVTQAFEEEMLGIKSNDTEIVEVIKRRHKAKTRIKQLKEEIYDGKSN